jgi:hypothetical protein
MVWCSFGTDSPLDRDIKERLMEQVFSVLPARADDQQAYMAFHKAESERRLVAQKRNALLAKQEKEAADREKERKAAANRPPLRPREKKEGGAAGAGGTGTGAKADGAAAGGAAGAGEADGTGGAGGSTSPKNADGTAKQPGESGNAATGEEEDEILDEDCSPERLLEIKAILYDVYSKFSQEKMTKIDRLLAKYVGHEEEFLRFVFNKYGVAPSQYEGYYQQKTGSGKGTPVVQTANSALVSHVVDKAAIAAASAADPAVAAALGTLGTLAPASVSRSNSSEEVGAEGNISSSSAPVGEGEEVDEAERGGAAGGEGGAEEEEEDGEGGGDGDGDGEADEGHAHVSSINSGAGSARAAAGGGVVGGQAGGTARATGVGGSGAVDSSRTQREVSI